MVKGGFRFKIFVYLSIMVLVQVLFIGIIFTRDVSNFTKTYKVEIVQKNLIDQVELLNKWINIKKSIVSTFAIELSSKVKKNSSSNEIENAVKHLSNQDMDLVNVYYTSKDGLNIVSGGRQPKADGRERDWYKGALSKETYLSKPYIDLLTGQYVLTVSKAVFGEKSNVIGVLGVDIYLKSLLDKIDIESDKSIVGLFLVDRYEKIIYSNNISMGSIPITEEMTVSALEKYSKGKYNHIEIKIPELQSKFYIYLKDDLYFTLMMNYNLDFWIAIIASVLGLIILLWYTSKILSTPIKRLVEIISDITIGDYQNRHVDQSDEDLSLIISLFNQLDSHVKKNIDDIELMKRDLKESNTILELKNDELEKSLESLGVLNQALKHAEKMYQELIENLDALIWIVNIDGYIEYANDALIEMLKIKNRDIRTIQLCDIILDLKDSEAFQGVGFFGKRNFVNIELSLNTLDFSREICVNANSTIIENNGELIAIQFIGRNITDEKSMYTRYYNKNKELMIINDISRSLTIQEDLNSILQFITDRISHMLNIAGVTIRIKDEFGYLIKKATSGQLMHTTIPYSPHIDSCHMGAALKEQQILVLERIEDLFMDEPFLKEVLEQIHSVIYLPLYNKSSQYGVLAIISENEIDSDKLNILKSLSENASMAIEKALLFEKLRNNYLKTIEALSRAVEEKVPNYKNHTKRVAALSKLIAEKFYLSTKDLEAIYISGLLHDIGKLGVEDDILIRDESDLTEDQIIKMSSHVAVGKKILDPIGLSKHIVEGVYLHHKRFDLTGYPENIVLEKLPLFARIIGVADAFDEHLIEFEKSNSQEILGFSLILTEMMKHSGTEFCPEVMLALKEIVLTNEARLEEVLYA